VSLLSVTAVAQQAPVPAAGPAAAESLRMFIASQEVTERIAKLEAAVSAGKKMDDGVRSLVSWGPFKGNLVYRNAPGAIMSANEDYAEFYVVLEGAGTMTLGGTLTDAKRTGAHSEAATAQGGTPYRVAKGDMIMVPPGTVHGVAQVEGKIAYFTMHLPLQPNLPAATAVPGR
jgi:mannose-6-phosphate isomerase-like protein (cupin superfamily)